MLTIDMIIIIIMLQENRYNLNLLQYFQSHHVWPTCRWTTFINLSYLTLGNLQIFSLIALGRILRLPTPIVECLAPVFHGVATSEVTDSIPGQFSIEKFLTDYLWYYSRCNNRIIMIMIFLSTTNANLIKISGNSQL